MKKNSYIDFRKKFNKQFEYFFFFFFFFFLWPCDGYKSIHIERGIDSALYSDSSYD